MSSWTEIIDRACTELCREIRYFDTVYLHQARNRLSYAGPWLWGLLNGTCRALPQEKQELQQLCWYEYEADTFPKLFQFI